MVYFQSISKIWFVNGYPLTGTISSTTFPWSVKRKDSVRRSLSVFSSGCFWGQAFAVEEAKAVWLFTHENEAVMWGRICGASPLLCELGLIGGDVLCLLDVCSEILPYNEPWS